MTNEERYANIPHELKELCQWVCYRIEERDGKPTKIPYRTDKVGRRNAKSNDPATWHTFEEVVEAVGKSQNRFDGIGFVLSESDPYVFIDLDHVVDDGTIEEWAQEIIERVGSYTEFSQSETGIHIVAQATKPGPRCRTHRHPKFEIYDDVRLVVFTGKLVSGTQAEIMDAQQAVDQIYFEVFGEDSYIVPPKEMAESLNRVTIPDQALIEKAMTAANGDKFSRLWNGNTGDHNGDDSAADMGLCCMLAFWTQRDLARMDRLFRESGLMRDKWDERRGDRTYGQMTIDAAVQSTTEVYEGSQRRRDNRQLAEAEEVPDFRVRSWPEPPAPEAFHGLAGDVVRVLDPHTEADPVALLSNFLVFFGSVIGRTAHFIAEADRHYTNLFAVQVGLSSKGRKGTAHGRVKEIFLDVDLPRNQSGLSSGEGLIWHVRDPIEKIEPVKERKEIIRYEPVIVDHGVEDKRLLCIETEFASVLRVLARDGNTLSAVIRNAWDTGDLQSLTKNSPGVATAAHISIIGHITRDELLRYLDSTEAGNGFGNRFLWVCVKRSKCLPEGGNLQQCDLQPIGERLREICQFARSVGEMKRDEEARQLWREVYPDLSEGKPGLLGAMIARAEAQVMRLACVYALLDCSELIRLEHLKAALAVWRYCENSARYIFGDSLGDPVADELLKALRSANEGMTRTEISKHFGRHKSAQEIGRALVTLHERGLVRREREEPAEGRPTERWHATRTQMSTHSSGEISEICEESPGDSGVTSLNSHISQPDTVVQSGVENDNGSLPNARQDTPHWSEENYEDI